MNNIYYDLYYIVIKNRDEKEIVIDQYEKDCINCKISKLLIIILEEKNKNETLKWRKLRS